MGNKWFSLIILTFFLSHFSGSAQVFDSTMKIYADKYQQEKIYIQFDKNVYRPGERIWYKAYVFSGHEPSLYSTNLYVEFFDESGTLLLRNVHPIAESSASGSFDLPESFPSAGIRVKAFTSWMLNFDSAVNFTKNLTVIGTATKVLSQKAESKISLHFFPEGGDLIAGVENNIAFKAEDSHGRPFEVHGVIYDHSGNTLFDFSSVHNGMGKFLLIPDSQNEFYAIWKDANGASQRTELPEVKNTGVVLRVMNANQKMVFFISKSAETTDYSKVIVLVHMNQQLVYEKTVELKSGISGTIPYGELPTGILQITVFDMNYSPLAERICFVNNQNYSFTANMNFTKQDLNKKGHNVLEIALPDSLKTNMSLSVTDADVDGKFSWMDNIFTGLLLTGELHGYIKDPYYYFQNRSDSLTQQLDLVMLTHGWRRFRWKDIAAGKLPLIKYPPDDYLSLNVGVKTSKKFSVTADENLMVFFQTKDSGKNMLTIPAAGKDSFHMDGLIFYDTAKIYYQLAKNPGLTEKTTFIFNNGLLSTFEKPVFGDTLLPVPSAVDSSVVRKLVSWQVAPNGKFDSSKAQQLKAVTVRSRTKSETEKMDKRYSSGLFGGGHATVFDIADDERASVSYINILYYLQGKVAGLRITGDPPTLIWREGRPAIYLDEVPSDSSMITNVNMSDIAMVKVFTPAGAPPMPGSKAGIIAVYTKKGEDLGKPTHAVNGLPTFLLAGYSPVREFYSPDYTADSTRTLPDFRTTIYWNPDLHGSKDTERITLPFYNSDITHHFRAVLEGFNEEGKLIHVEKIID
ncbi:MAG TPA: hypothetical protein VK772_05635 [Puia sp.]|nr:hypothetical protein [Puia sp.]